MEPVDKNSGSDYPDLEKEDRGLLLVDLLRLHKTFSFRRYRTDIIGLLIASGLVFLIIIVALVLSRIGA